MGATVIEKHFTLNRADGGVDAEFSLEPAEMHNLVEETERAWQGLGAISYGATEKEAGSLKFRRSLYIVKDLKAGEMLTADNLRAIRPGYGLSPKHMEMLLGQRVRKDVSKGTAASFNLIID